MFEDKCPWRGVGWSCVMSVARIPFFSFSFSIFPFLEWHGNGLEQAAADQIVAVRDVFCGMLWFDDVDGIWWNFNIVVK